MSASDNDKTDFHGNPIPGGKTSAGKSVPSVAIQVDVPVHELIKAWCAKHELGLGATATAWLIERLRAEVGKELLGDGDEQLRKHLL